MARRAVIEICCLILAVGGDINGDVTESDLELVEAFNREQSQDAFTELVRRHLDLVYCAALRQVRSPQLAEEVAQSVFMDLARNAACLKGDTILTAWLYKVTRRTAINVVRGEARRQVREQIASQLNAMNATAADWTHIEPVLDEAMDALDDTDRTSVLLRYFENRSLREVGEVLGITDAAAQKRVSRAVERLREFFSKRGLGVSAAGLLLLISGHAVQAAPVGLAAAISSATAVGGTVAAAATATATKAITMTTLQKTLIIATIVATAGVGIYEARRASGFRKQVEVLQQQQASLLNQNKRLESDYERVSNKLAGSSAANTGRLRELLKLRGEVAALRRQQREAATFAQSNPVSPSASDVPAQPNKPAPFQVQLVVDTPSDDSVPSDTASGETLHLEKAALLDYTAISSATVALNASSGAPEINVEFSPEGNELFAAVTKENINKRLAIVLGGRLYAAPVIRSEISGGKTQITGSFTEEEALELAAKINEAVRTY